MINIGDFYAEKLVAQLLSAKTAEVPVIAEQLPRMEVASAQCCTMLSHRRKLVATHASNFTLPTLRVFERGQVDYLRERAVATFRDADNLARQGEWKDAVVALDRAIALHPEQLDWLHRSAKLRLYLGDVDG